MTAWDKSQCDEVQGSDWEGDHGGPGEPGEPGGGVGTPWEPPPEQICAEVLLLTTTPYAINFEESLQIGTPKLNDMGIVQEVRAGVEDPGLTFGASFEFMRWSGLNGYGDDAIFHDTTLVSARIFGRIGYGEDTVFHDVLVPSAQVYGLKYDKANETVHHDVLVTGASVTAG
jgi:hypothetical protein